MWFYFIFIVTEEESEVSVNWRKANVTAFFKKGPKINPRNYRMVSLISVSVKIMEWVLLEHISGHVKLN